jgi:hypothetical protein
MHAFRAADAARFTLSVTPARQGVVPGGEATFSVGFVRPSGFTGAVALRVEGLPRGARARWRLAHGRRSGVVPRAETGAFLTLSTARGTPLGNWRVRVLATGGGTTRATRITLNVGRPGSLRFSLRASPARRTVPRGASAAFRIRITRARGVRGPVTLRVLGLPRGASATRTRTGLRVATGAGQPLGPDRLVIEGTSMVGRRAVRRYAVVVLTVVPAHRVSIDGDLATLLHPGARAPLDLVLTNPHPFRIRVTALRVSMGARTTNPDCAAGANYAVTQYSGGYPLVLRPGSGRLSALVPDASAWPHVSMHALPTNQDACRGAVLSLDYSGQATR